MIYEDGKIKDINGTRHLARTTSIVSLDLEFVKLVKKARLESVRIKSGSPLTLFKFFPPSTLTDFSLSFLLKC